VPALDSDGRVTHVYAVARLKDGGIQREVMTTAEVEKIRKKSRAGQSGPWKEHWDEMAKKTVIRRLVKLLPISVDLLSQWEQAEAAVEGEPTAEELLAAFESSNGGQSGVRAAELEAKLDAIDAVAATREAGEEG